ncbi:MAG TPA: hypothetical protein V6D47_10390 [Oscillatoriaceae cyanobacterium]
MTGTRVSARILLPVLSLALFACQNSTGVMPSASFQLAPNSQPVAPQAPGTELQSGSTPLVSAAQSASHVSAGAGGASSGGGGASSVAPAAHGGAVTVEFTGLLQALKGSGHYRVLATATDVDHVIVTLSMPGQPDRVQVVMASQIASGQSSVTFTGLPTGTATISITAYDNYGDPIGAASQSTPITNGQNSSVDLDVPIDPNASAASAGSGSVSIDVNFVPTPSPTPSASATVVATFANCSCFYADNAGRFYGEAIGEVGQMYRVLLSAYSVDDGAKVADDAVAMWNHTSIFPWAVPIAYNAVSSAIEFAGFGTPGTAAINGVSFDQFAQLKPERQVAVDSAGDVFFDGATGGVEKDASGTSVPTTVPMTRAFTLDSVGNFWTDKASPATSGYSVSKYNAAGNLLGTYPIAFEPSTIKPDKAGDVWVSDMVGFTTGTRLVKVSASGTVGTVVSLTVDGFCLDAEDHVWVATGSSLVELASEGTTLATYPITAKNVAFGNGYVFADIGGSVDKIQP